MSLTGRKRDKEKNSRERWVERKSSTSVHVRNPKHQCSDVTAAKIQLFLLDMHVSCTIHDRKVLSNQASETWRVGIVASPPCAGQKKCKMFPNAVSSKSFSRVSVPQLPKSVSFVTEREREQRDLPFLRLSNTLPELSTIFVTRCFSISFSLFEDFSFITLWIQNHFGSFTCTLNSSDAKNKAVESN